MKATPLSMNILAIAALASCAGDRNITRTQVSMRSDSTLSGQIFDQVNAYRTEVGSGQLQRHPELDRLAQDHCQYLCDHSGTFSIYGKYVSHMGDHGRALVAIRRLNMMSTSENVASTMSTGSDSQTASNLLYLWKKSPDHDYALQMPVWTHTGVGSVVGPDGRVYATQLFSTKNYSEIPYKSAFY